MPLLAAALGVFGLLSIMGLFFPLPWDGFVLGGAAALAAIVLALSSRPASASQRWLGRLAVGCGVCVLALTVLVFVRAD